MATSCFDLSAGAAATFAREENVPHWRCHRRTKSAGSSSSKDFSLYTNMGLYAHHGVLPSDTVPSELSQGTDTTCNSTYEFVRVVDRAERLRHERELENSENLRECGVFNFRPKFIQRFASIRVFVFLSCILVTLHQALSSGYFNSVVTTIEKRFDIPSRVSGAIASTYEVGNMITIIFVSYLGSHRHIPVWIGKGILVIGVGSCLFALPYFLDQQVPSPKEILNQNMSLPGVENTCQLRTYQSIASDRSSPFLNPPDMDPKTCNEGRSSNALYILIFMLSQVLIGVGGSPIFTLGTTYIDDHVKKESSSMYIGCMYSMVAFGLVLGFLLGGFLLSYHEDAILFGVEPVDVYPGHPNWIGAWWAGFVICGIALMLVALPYFGFPKELKREREKLMWEENRDFFKSGPNPVQWKQPNEEDENLEAGKNEDEKTYGKNIRDIPRSIWRLICNPVYMITCMGSCMELAIVSGFVVFLPKYLETQFSIGKSQANIFTGGIAIPGACVGIFMGGYILKRFQMKPKGAIQCVLFFNLVCMGLYTLLYFLGCDNIRMAGTTQPYFNNTELETRFQVNLTADCNMGCHCSPNHIEPVCGSNGITYFSPCHAGCRAEAVKRPDSYSNCACIIANNTKNHGVTAIPLATMGPCPHICDAMIPFMVLLFIMTLVVSITQMPLLMITLRSVDEEERAFALGMQFVIFRLFGYIPSPILFGNVIDSTCILWRARCGRPGGFCLFYDIQDFRLRYIGVCSGLKVASGLLFFLDWFLISRRERKELQQPPALTLGEIMSSIISLDRLSAVGWVEGGAATGEDAAQPLALQNAFSEEDEDELEKEETNKLSPSAAVVPKEPPHQAELRGRHRRHWSDSGAAIYDMVPRRKSVNFASDA